MTKVLASISSQLAHAMPWLRSIEQESAHDANLLPPDESMTLVARDATQVADYLIARLQTGYAPTQMQTISANKIGFGHRPVALVALQDRIVYRALVNAALPQAVDVPHSAAAYRQFVLSPIRFAIGMIMGAPLPLTSSRVTHVIKTDIVAFYQFIDHGRIQEELTLLGTDPRITDVLGGMLGGMNGRHFGLPQLVGASDVLAELYGDAIARDLSRRGLTTWRFNDDFRVACEGYREVLSHLETIAEVTREYGLVPSEHKTTTPKYRTYVHDNIGLDIDEDEWVPGEEPINLVDSDYADAGERLDVAREYVKSLSKRRSKKDAPRYAGFGADESRRLRTALRTLTRNRDPSAARLVPELLSFVPAVTPELVRHLHMAWNVKGAGAEAPLLRRWLDERSPSPWQLVWVLWLVRSHVNQTAVAQGFTQEVAALAHHSHPLVRVQGTLGMAELGILRYRELSAELIEGSEALEGPLLLAARALRSQGKVTDQAWNALLRTSPIWRAVLQ